MVKKERQRPIRHNRTKNIGLFIKKIPVTLVKFVIIYI